MNKKILYGIFLLSVFLLSTASMVQPVYGYTFGVPKQAVGMTTEGEVKIFDEDAVESHLGKGVDLEGLHAGDSDVVGAKSKSHIKELDKDAKLDYLNDWVFEPAGIPASIDNIDSLLYSMCANLSAWPAGTYGPIGWLASYALSFLPDNPFIQAKTEASLAIAALAGFPSYATLAGKYSKDYEGAILTRDKWDFTEKAYKEKPDVKDDEVPFFGDPRDWNDVARNLEGAEHEVGVSVDDIQTHWADSASLFTTMSITGCGWYFSLVGVCLGGAGFGAYAAVNNTIVAQLMSLGPGSMDYFIADYTSIPIPLSQYLLGAMGVPNDFSSYGGPTYQKDYVAGLMGLGDRVYETIYAQIHAQVPDKAGFLLGQLIAGQPAMVPQADYIEKVLDEYDLDEDELAEMYGFEYGKDIRHSGSFLDGEVDSTPLGAKSRFTGTDLEGETVYPEAYIDYKVEGSNFIAEIEWQEEMIDPADWTIFGGKNEDELSNFEIEFPYGDTGTQGTVSYKDGTEIIWQMGGVESIPGYEITIILGVSAVSILGVIYILMRKRKM